MALLAYMAKKRAACEMTLYLYSKKTQSLYKNGHLIAKSSCVLVSIIVRSEKKIFTARMKKRNVTMKTIRDVHRILIYI